MCQSDARARFSDEAWLIRHSNRKYALTVAKMLKQIKGKCRISGDIWLILVHRKIKLAIFVQCNILLFMRAVELRKVQAI
jgi:hypothetical protein